MIEKLFELLNPKSIDNENLDLKTYGLFDGVKYPMLWSDLEDGVLSYDMLFREENLRTEMEKVAPYFVELDFTIESGAEQSIVLLECYGKNGCIFLSSKLDFEEILEKMREIFYVYALDGQKGFLRFYSPLIFETILEQKDLSLIYTLFSDISYYICEQSSEVKKCIEYSYTNDNIQATITEQKDENEH